MTAMVYPTTNPQVVEQLNLTRGQGVYVFDDAGKSYLEGMAGLWCTTLGYGNEEIIACAEQQMRELSFAHLFSGKSHPAAMQLADTLSAMVPVDDAQVFLGCSGSDANDTLMKLIRYHASASGQPERTRIIARDSGYHGVSVGTTALSGFETMHRHFRLPFDALGVLRTGSADYFREARAGETQEQFVQRRADELEALILDAGPATIAAMIIEPINAAGGVIVPPAGYFEAITAVLDRYGIWLWDDEVVCGFGRLGTDFGANRFGFSPSMMICAKGLSSAYVPISAAVVAGEIAEVITQQAGDEGVLGHGYTYSGHPVGCAVANKVLQIYQRDGIYARAQTMGEYLRSKLDNLRDSHPLVFSVNSVGMLGAVELMHPRASHLTLAPYCAYSAEQHGLIVRPVLGTRIALCPPLIITEAELDELFDKLVLALNDTHEAADRHIAGTR